MSAGLWLKCAACHPRLFLRLVWLLLRGVWLDIQLWRIRRVNDRLRAQMAALHARIAIARAKSLR